MTRRNILDLLNGCSSMELLLQTYNKYTDRLKGKPTECKLACIHKWISVLFVSISLYLFINETGELLFIFIMRKPKMETNALARYKIFFFCRRCMSYRIVDWSTIKWIEHSIQTYSWRIFEAGWKDDFLFQVPIQRHWIYYMELDTVKGGHRILYGREKNFV